MLFKLQVYTYGNRLIRKTDANFFFFFLIEKLKSHYILCTKVLGFRHYNELGAWYRNA